MNRLSKWRERNLECLDFVSTADKWRSQVQAQVVQAHEPNNTLKRHCSANFARDSLEFDRALYCLSTNEFQAFYTSLWLCLLSIIKSQRKDIYTVHCVSVVATRAITLSAPFLTYNIFYFIFHSMLGFFFSSFFTSRPLLSSILVHYNLICIF